MIRTLIALDKDLASSIALRYASNAARNFDMALSALHVEDPGPQGRLPGTGKNKLSPVIHNIVERPF